jgi:hypothetical protein
MHHRAIPIMRNLAVGIARNFDELTQHLAIDIAFYLPGTKPPHQRLNLGQQPRRTIRRDSDAGGSSGTLTPTATLTREEGERVLAMLDMNRREWSYFPAPEKVLEIVEQTRRSFADDFPEAVKENPAKELVEAAAAVEQSDVWLTFKDPLMEWYFVMQANTQAALVNPPFFCCHQ